MHLTFQRTITLLALALSACIPASTSITTETPRSLPSLTSAPSTEIPSEVNLSGALIDDCQASSNRPPGPALGEQAIEFTLHDVDGDEYTLSDLLEEKPVVLIFGSFT